MFPRTGSSPTFGEVHGKTLGLAQARFKRNFSDLLLDRRGKLRPIILRTEVCMPHVRFWLLFIAALSLARESSLIGQQKHNDTASGASVTLGVDGILNAFQRFSVVGIADWHGLAQEEDFYVQLLRSPRFPREVGNVVVEFGGAAQQTTIDRYVAGEDVPYEKLRAVWTDTVGWLPTVVSVGYLNVFAQVREINKVLPPTEQIHVWLGEPPVDWSKINKPEDLKQLAQRDSYPAQLIQSQILAKKKKTLVIYGALHFTGLESVRSLVEQGYPRSFYVVMPYRGSQGAASTTLDQYIQTWRQQTSRTGEQETNAVLLMGQQFTDQGDALLYLGPAASLTKSPTIPDLYLDEAFRREIDRRSMIMSGSPLPAGIPPASPMFENR
jgi:hypothetical protein